jgi:subtilisin-like proprotein convertase family protein
VANGFSNAGIIQLVSENAGFSSTMNVTAGVLVNTGTIRSDVGTGGARTLGGAVDNRGTVVVMHPLTVGRANAAHAHSGVFNVSAGQALTFTGAGSTLAHNAGGTFSGTGTVNFGALTVNLVADLTVTETSLRFPGGTINGPGTFVVPAAVVVEIVVLDNTTVNAPLQVAGHVTARGVNGAWTGAVAVASTGTVRLLGSGVMGNVILTVANGFSNAGIIQLVSENAGFSSTMNVTAGVLVNTGTIRSDVGTGGQRSFGASLDNQGILLVAHSLTINKVAGMHVNTGTITIHAATTLVISQGAFENAVNGVINGAGTLDISAAALAFTNNGVVAPGTSPGVLTVRGSLPTSPTSIFRMDVAGPIVGTGHDQLVVTATASLGGMLELLLEDNFQPGGTDSFTILTANLISGAFANAPHGSELPTADGRGRFRVNYGPASPFNPNHVVLGDFVPDPGPHNQPPVVALPSGPVDYLAGSGPVLLDPAATVTDPDSPNFDTGTLTVRFTANGTADDRLGIRHQGDGPGEISVDGNTVRFGGVNIDEFTGGQDGATPLVVTFNANATPTAVQALVRNLTYHNVSATPSTLSRTVQIVVTDGDGGTSTAVLKTISVTAVKQDPAITWPDPAPITYGTPLGVAQLNATASVAGAFVYLPAAGTVLNAGVHVLSVTFTPADTANFNTVTANVSIEVRQADQSISFGPLADKVYGDPPFGIAAATSSGLAAEFSVVSGPASVSGSVVTLTGAGVVTLRASQPGDGNYNPAEPIDQTFTVTRAPLIIRANDATRAVGEPNPAFSATFLGLVNQDSPAVLDPGPSFSTVADESSAAGQYPIAVSGAMAANYEITFEDGTLTVTGAQMAAITWPNPPDILYGTALNGQLNATADTPGTFVYSPPAGTVLNAGDAQVLSVTFTPDDAVNFSVAVAQVQINVMPAPLTLTADDQHAAKGTAFPPFTYTATGLVGNDTVAVPPALSTTANAGSPEGTYPINISGASDPNYTMTHVPGTLTITAAELVSLTVTPSTPFIDVGQNQQFTATGTFSDGTTQDLTGSVVWTSADETVAGISGSGLANALAVGNSLISASQGNIAGATRLIVTPVTEGTTFINPAVIDMSNGPASLYPSTIEVSGLSGTIAKVTVQLIGVTHEWPADLDIMLVSPTGANTILVSDAGSSFAVANVTIVLDDSVPSPLPQNAEILPGAYRPVNYSSADDFFPPPAPVPGSDSSSLAAFIGSMPNGTWSLFVVDDSAPDSGSITGGWSLTLATVPNTPPTISDIPNQVARAGETTPEIPFSIGDQETPADELVVQVFSSNPALLPAEQIVLDGVGPNRTLTLRPAGTDAGAATVTVTVTDGLGASAEARFEVTVLPAEAASEVTRTVRFSNRTPIRIPTMGQADVYPSVIEVSDLPGRIVRVVVTLHGLSHTWPDDLDIMLSLVGGPRAMVMSDAGGRRRVDNVTLRIEDAAGARPPNNGQIFSGSYQPSDFPAMPDRFPAPAPGGPYPAMFSVFNDLEANGAWALFVFDDTIHDSGFIAGGWDLEITTTTAPQNGVAGRNVGLHGDLGLHGLNPEEDLDEETETLFKELAANKSLISFESMRPMPDGTVHFELLGQAGQRVGLQSATDLSAWETLSTIIAPADFFPMIIQTEEQLSHELFRAVITR